MFTILVTGFISHPMSLFFILSCPSSQLLILPSQFFFMSSSSLTVGVISLFNYSNILLIFPKLKSQWKILSSSPVFLGY